MEMHTKYWSGKAEVKRPLRNLGVDGVILLKRILGKWYGKVWTGFAWIRIRTIFGPLSLL
jgi:hypothetical protein